MPWTRLSRRHLLRSGAAIGLAAASPALAAPAITKGTHLTFWGGLIFSDAANKLQVDTINKWGAANGVHTDVVMINQNETVQKVSAAIAAGTMPDALDLDLDLLLLLTRQNVFVPLEDMYQSIGKAQGGWFPSVEKATDVRKLAGALTGIPFGISGNLLHRRKDVLDKAGFPNPPATWDELTKQSLAVNKPPLYAMGFALSNVGDGNTQVGVLQSFGGRIADDAGRHAAIKSDATRTYLRWVKSNWDHHLYPPGNTTWDGAGDNNAYLSGQAVFIANTGSVGIAAKKNDPDLYADTAYSSLPSGPKGNFTPIDPQVRAIPRSSKNQDAARALIEHLAQPAYLSAYYESAIYGPVLLNQKQFKVFDGKDPIHAGLLDLVENGAPPGGPDVYNPAYAEAQNTFVVPRMIQRVVIDNWDLDRAMDEAQQRIQAIYDKYAPG